ncbi:MAG: radical SAM protein [Acidobacteria bacterium]|nr:radical SAM protein [Acidobacteriota bacterium]
MRALLISTYDLGRQPFGLASPAAWLRKSGVEVDCVDTSRDPLDDGRIAAASLVAFYLPMHTATRLAVPLIDRVCRVNPSARLCAYGLYAPLNAHWLRARGVTDIIGPEAEAELVDIATSRLPTSNSQGPEPKAHGPEPKARSLPRLQFVQPDRAGLPPPARYASLRMPDGTRRTIGSTDASRGCKHLCRHCPIVPVYRGRFRIVPIDVVIADIRAQVASGAEHISFGDPDFLNGPTHARRLVERIAREFPGLSYDVTVKIEHLLRHAEMIPVLRDTGCVFVTSAVESIDDVVLDRLRKGHTRADFIRAVALCRDAGLTLAPTFIPFTPWTTPDGYVELLDLLDGLALVEHVAPIQLGIRLLITAESPLLELLDIRRRVTEFDHASLTWPWRHEDPRVDALQEQVMQIVRAGATRPRAEVFSAIATLARAQGGFPPAAVRTPAGAAVPYISEPWYCCAEPMEQF